MGSRSLQTAGSAVHVASETVLDKAKELASHLLEASTDDIVTGRGLTRCWCTFQLFELGRTSSGFK